MMPSRGINKQQLRSLGMVERRRQRRPGRALQAAARALVPVSAWLLLAALVTSHPLGPASDYESDFESGWSEEEEEAALPPDRYFANDSLLGLPLPCTDDEKECLRYNRLLLPSDGRCYALGDGPGRCLLAADRCLWERRGRLSAECAPTDLCRPHNANRAHMAFDGRCLKPRELLNACGPGAVNLVQHFFGGAECAPVPGISPPPPRYVPQPARRGRCAFPNLRHDLTSVTNEEGRARFKMCSQEQSVCFARKRVWLAANRSCSALLAPCGGAGEWLALNRSAWEGGRVEATCVPVHPCGPRARLMAFNRRCYDAATVLRALCPGGVLLPNAFGEMTCVTRHYYRHVIDLTTTRPEACEITQSISFAGDPVAVNLAPDCDLNEGHRCIF